MGGNDWPAMLKRFPVCYKKNILYIRFSVLVVLYRLDPVGCPGGLVAL
jgi:hypothetical protein